MGIEQIRVRIMSEAYDLADRGDHEGYNAIKVMCGEVLEKIAAAVAAEREACAKAVEDYCGAWDDEGYALATAIRSRSEK